MVWHSSGSSASAGDGRAASGMCGVEVKDRALTRVLDARAARAGARAVGLHAASSLTFPGTAFVVMHTLQALHFHHALSRFLARAVCLCCVINARVS